METFGLSKQELKECAIQAFKELWLEKLNAGASLPEPGLPLREPKPIPPQAFAHMKIAPAIEKLLRLRGQPMRRDEILDELKGHGCELASDPKHDFRALAITIAANKRRFYQDGETVGLVDWRPEVAKKIG